MPIWVKLPQLPLCLWGLKSLNKIGSAIGNPLMTDECTTQKLRVSYARILVEVDTTQKLVEEITISDRTGGKIKQIVEYEWKPEFCEKCQKAGHQCGKKKVVKKWIPRNKQADEVKADPLPKTPVQNTETEGEDKPEGWITVGKAARHTGKAIEVIGKLKEISSRLLKLRPTIAILIETRVKNKNAKKIRDKLKLPHNYLDNYKWHDNGRLWIEWDNSKIDLDRRKVLWKDLEAIHKHQQGPWCVIGDFNNVTKAQDRIGGKAVTESEYIDLLNMMETTGLAEMDTTGEFYTWTNKQVIGTIYSRIDRVLGNLDWFQDNLDTVLTVLPANVSDHSLLCVSRKDPIIKNNKNFRFSNCLIEMEGYNDMVKASWSKPTRGSPMVRLWNKLKRLQQDMRRFSKPLSNLKQNLIKAREDLQFAQENLRNNNMNGDSIDRVRQLTEEVINLNELEEKDAYAESKSGLDKER
ncbi:uncharacterized protein [Glycine max]|uniref:uncharacterized protein n=1 Tax=Glycine max TaxID=3847 RepID=UPI0003DEC185|nr:uncharacterized protein LOC102666350 [Glycine max]|eukprot:XP_006598642.1 uncharacterized protein LOC102666350 [Glycine max]